MFIPTFWVFFFFLTHAHSVGESCLLLPLPLGFVGDVIARPALVFAQRSHLETGLVAAFCLQHRVGHGGRGRTAELAEGFWEGPETVFHAGQGVVCTCGNTDGERKAEKKTCLVHNQHLFLHKLIATASCFK